MNEPSTRFPGSRLLNLAGPLLILALFALGIWALDRELTHFHWKAMWQSVRETPPGKLMLAAVLTLGGYASIAACFARSFRYAERPLPWRKVSMIALIVSSVSMNLGASFLTSNLARARLLSRERFSLGEMVRSAVAGEIFSMFGLLFLAGSVLTWRLVAMPRTIPLHLASTRILGVLLLVVAVAGMAAMLARSRPLKFRDWQVPVPRRGILVSGIGFGVLDWLFAALTVIALLPASGLATTQLLAIVMLAQLAAACSHIPGGLGVFEVVIVSLLPETVSQSEIIGSLLIYRGVYLMAPLGIALVLLLRMEWRGRPVYASMHPLLAHWRKFAPTAMSALVFLAGGVLLVSGNLPAVPERLQWLRDVLPLALVEASHFLASISGVLLLVLAWSLRRRVNAAWWATAGLLGVAMILSMIKGVNFEESIFLGLVLSLVLSLRAEFHRQAGLFARRFSMGWWMLVLGLLMLTTWMGFLAYSHVEYRNELWWRFTLNGDAPRFLRASAGIAVALSGIALAQLLRPSAHGDERRCGMPDVQVSAIIAQSSSADAGLAWLGDKRFMVSSDGRAALMYGVHGRSRIVLGDVIGPEDAWEDLLWNLLDECDQAGQRPVVYGLSEKNAHHYLDVGFHLFKVGEEARVPLGAFSLEGSRRKELRNTLSKLERQGCTFEILPQSELDVHFARLRTISDAWLKGKNAQEKSFSLGSFNEDYLRHFPMAVVRRDGEIIAFANVLNSPSGKEELSIDLMRFHPEIAPNGTMQYLFTKLMLWGQEQGYQWFSLGIAPLSGLNSRSLAPLWHKVGGIIFHHAEHFYNFQGLRAYKDKFAPVWSSAYVAVRSSWDMPAALLDSSALVSGGLAGMVKK